MIWLILLFPLQITDSKNDNICSNCWQKVQDFDQFYVHIENVHRNISIPVMPSLVDDTDIKLENIDSELIVSEIEIPTPIRNRRGRPRKDDGDKKIQRHLIDDKPRR